MNSAITHKQLTKFFGGYFFRGGALVLASCIALSGCDAMAQQPAPPSTSSSNAAMDQALLKQVSSIADLADNIRATSGTTFAPNYNGFTARTPDQRPHGSTAASMVPAHISGPLGQKVYVQWSGSASVFLQALAQKMNYRFENRLNGMPSPDVAINAKASRIFSVLRTVAIQLPDNMTVKVDPGKLVLLSNGGGYGA